MAYRSKPYRSSRRRPIWTIILPIFAVMMVLLVVILFLFAKGRRTDTGSGPIDSASPDVSPSQSVASSPSPSVSSSTSPSPSVSPSVSPSPSVTPSVSPDPSPSPSAPEKQPESNIPWYLTLVNAEHPLPEDFTPQLSQLPNGLYFDSRAIDALMEMVNACRAAGLQPVIGSAYRSIDDQIYLHNRKINYYLDKGMTYEAAYAEASTIVAIPGCSEHNLGLAVDLCALSYQILDEGQLKTAEQQWFMAHCHEYGFILRYPIDKSDLTGIIYEPWHYRYVGKEAAVEIAERGICLEEYISELYNIE